MNLIIKQLQEDHKQLVRVLYHLEREAKCFSGIVKGDARIETLLDILDYIQVYPEIWHHPTEDVIFDCLFQKDISEGALLKSAMDEHEILEVLTENLLQYLNKAASDDGFSPVRFAKSVTDYVNRQLRHMEFEQKNLFPLAEKYLDQQNWISIRDHLKQQQQALKQPKAKHYESICRDIAGASVITAH